MPTMIPRHNIKIHRKGSDALYPPIGQAFEFTDAEVKAIRAHNHNALRAINVNTARTDAETMEEGMEMPDADATRDANVLSKVPAKAPGSRNQGGSLQEGQIARGKMGKTPNTLPAPTTDEPTDENEDPAADL